MSTTQTCKCHRECWAVIILQFISFTAEVSAIESCTGFFWCCRLRKVCNTSTPCTVECVCVRVSVCSGCFCVGVDWDRKPAGDGDDGGRNGEGRGAQQDLDGRQQRSPHNCTSASLARLSLLTLHVSRCQSLMRFVQRGVVELFFPSFRGLFLWRKQTVHD